MSDEQINSASLKLDTHLFPAVTILEHLFACHLQCISKLLLWQWQTPDRMWFSLFFQRLTCDPVKQKTSSLLRFSLTLRSLFFSLLSFSSVIFACSVWLCQVRSDGDALYEEIYECVSAEQRRLQLCLKSLPFCLPLMSPSVLIPVNGYKSRALNSLPGPIQGNWLSEQTYCCSICCSFTFLCHWEQKLTLLSGYKWLNYMCYTLCCLLACI